MEKSPNAREINALGLVVDKQVKKRLLNPSARYWAFFRRLA